MYLWFKLKSLPLEAVNKSAIPENLAQLIISQLTLNKDIEHYSSN